MVYALVHRHNDDDRLREQSPSDHIVCAHMRRGRTANSIAVIPKDGRKSCKKECSCDGNGCREDIESPSSSSVQSMNSYSEDDGEQQKGRLGRKVWPDEPGFAVIIEVSSRLRVLATEAGIKVEVLVLSGSGSKSCELGARRGTGRTNTSRQLEANTDWLGITI
jgi:hypothetical protein